MSTRVSFDDLLHANAQHSETFTAGGLPGRAAAGVALVTCMDSRIDPLAILGLAVGDAAVLRTPGGRVDETALEGVILAVNLLGADRVLVVAHTRCAVGGTTSADLTARVAETAGRDTAGQAFHAIEDPASDLARDVALIRDHPLVPETVEVAGFVYDVDTGQLTQQV